MKKILSVLLIAATSLSLYSYSDAPIKYLDIVYGATPQEVNDKLIASNLITTAIEPEAGILYKSNYPDPDIVWYDNQVTEWVNISFTTVSADQLFTKDASIFYFARPRAGEIKRITLSGANFSADSNPPVGQNTLWVYSFYFYNDELFAVSMKYENDLALEAFKARNPNNPNANPGYIIPGGLLDRTLNALHLKYGGFDKTFTSRLDKFTTLVYGNFESERTATSVSMFYGDYFNGKFNATLCYTDDFRLKKIADRFQNFSYEPNESIREDIPLDLDLNAGNIHNIN